jgi:hypothetical protein
LEHEGAAPRLVHIGQIAEKAQLEAGAAIFYSEEVTKAVRHQFTEALQWRSWRWSCDWCNLTATYDASLVLCPHHADPPAIGHGRRRTHSRMHCGVRSPFEKERLHL